MEPRNRARPGCQRAPNTRQATSWIPFWRGVYGPGGVGDLWHAWKHGERNPGGPASGLADMPGPHGEPLGYDRDGRVQGVGPLQRTEEAFEQGSPPRDWRRRWREGSWPRGTWRGKPGAGHRAGVSCHRRSAAYGRHLWVPARRPEAGARCGSAARRDLCGGHRVTGVPTATVTVEARNPRSSLDDRSAN
jgi:hypothetical protein